MKIMRRLGLLLALLLCLSSAPMLRPATLRAFRLSRSNVSFGHVAVGSSKIAVVRLCNVGSAWYGIQVVETASDRQPDASEFYLSMDWTPNDGIGIAPGACADIHITFTPSGNGLRASKLVVLDENGAQYEAFLVGEGGNQSVPLISNVQAQ